MTDDPRAEELLDALLDSHATPEEVCRDHPELLPEVRARWRRVCRVEAELDALFPTPLAADAPTPPPGAALPTVPGYEVEAVLGRGGMGVVFRTRHLRLNRVVALKMMLAGAYAGPHERERFRREAEAVGRLLHPNVVQVYDVGDADGRPYFTMEYVDGGTLAQRLTGAPQPARDAATLVATLAGAVEAAHQGGIVHRDLKPGNVLLAADGTPKVGDFGLAKYADSDTGLTRTGAALGTPGYMAPEQARGKADAVGPAADIYALGAILYELLTGRPPFRVESDAVTVQQVIDRDTVPPSRLNPKVSRDLETVCLTCLHKEPPRRYATAAALADDLSRFLRGEAITARPDGRVARLVRRVRRRPLLSAALAACMVLTAALAGGGLWIYSDRAAARAANLAASAATAAARTEVERAAGADLDEMDGAMKRLAWADARAALERARGRLGGDPPDQLAGRIGRGDFYLKLVDRLDAIRLDGYVLAEDGLDFRPANGAYEEAFGRAGLVRPGKEEPAAAAARVAVTPVGPVLVAALDNWSSCCFEDTTRKAWLLETARLADTDSTGWRTRASDPAFWKDGKALTALLDAAPTAYPSLPVLLAVEVRMTNTGRDPSAFLRRVQQAYPTDFWTNMRLARALYKREPGEAVRFYQAALAVRPDAPAVRNELGMALEKSGRRDEAVVQYRAAVQRAPTFVPAQANLAVLLSRLKRHDEALKQVDAAIDLGIRHTLLYTTRGYSLNALGQPTGAIAALREAVTLAPKNLAAQSGLRAVLQQERRPEEARAAWQAALDADPSEHNAWYGYAEFCLYLGRKDEYLDARTALLDKFGLTTDPYEAERVARACLLRPAVGRDLRRAVALAERAASDKNTKNPSYRHFLFVRGLADFRQGRLDRAMATMRGEGAGVLGPAPRLVLAMALHEYGQAAEARETLAAAVSGHDWAAGQVTDQDDWIFHALRREAEDMIRPRQP